MTNISFNNELLTPHFALLEMTESRTAKKHGIDNNPTQDAVENLKRLCLHTLEPLREALQLPVVITSGFRCQRLNEILSHSARRSQHLTGCAADFYVGQGQVSGSKFKVQNHRELLLKAFRLILTDKTIDYDQLILYPDFIHVSYVSPEANRHCIMTAEGDGKYKALTRENALKLV